MVWHLGKQKNGTPAHGAPVPGGKRQVVVTMDTDQFEEVRARAVTEGTSFAEQIRNLIEWGLESVRDD